MRVGLLIDTFNIGGAESMVFETAKLLQANGVEPVLSPWFSSMLDKQMQLGIFCDSVRIERIRDGLVAELKIYKDKCRR